MGKRLGLGVLGVLALTAAADARPRLFGGGNCGQQVQAQPTHRPVLNAVRQAVGRVRAVAVGRVVVTGEVLGAASNVLTGTGAAIRGTNCAGGVCRQ